MDVEKTEKTRDKYYLVRGKAVPEVLLKVLETKKKMQHHKMTVQQAADEVGISRSSFYKYQDDIFPFHEKVKGETITFIMQISDEPGLLSEILQVIAAHHGNILTIHQSIPTNGMATLTISVEVSPEAEDVMVMLDDIEVRQGVHDVRILGRE